MSEDNFIWLQALSLTPGMLAIYELYLRVEIESSQKTMDAAIDVGDLLKAARAKGSRDAYVNLLHHVKTRAQGG